MKMILNINNGPASEWKIARRETVSEKINDALRAALGRAPSKAERTEYLEAFKKANPQVKNLDVIFAGKTLVLPSVELREAAPVAARELTPSEAAQMRQVKAKPDLFATSFDAPQMLEPTPTPTPAPAETKTAEAEPEKKSFKSMFLEAARVACLFDDPLIAIVGYMRSKKGVEAAAEGAKAAAHTAPKGLMRFIKPAAPLGGLEKLALRICVPLQALSVFATTSEFLEARKKGAPLLEQVRLGGSAALVAGALICTLAAPPVAMGLFYASLALYYGPTVKGWADKAISWFKSSPKTAES